MIITITEVSASYLLYQSYLIWYGTKQPFLFVVHPEVGAQPGRGCEEQIFTVPFLIDIARKTRKVLYITFIDYQKAYEKVNRLKLIEYLDHKGCMFLQAVQQSMPSTELIGNNKFTTTFAVKQGGSSSCNHLTAYIDPTIDTFGPDDWLRNLHLLLMDDTIVFATSREKLHTKLKLLNNCADDIGMILHPTKS